MDPQKKPGSFSNLNEQFEQISFIEKGEEKKGLKILPFLQLGQRVKRKGFSIIIFYKQIKVV